MDASNLPKDFALIPGTRRDGSERPCVRVAFRGEELAICEDEAAALRYIAIYGYMAEWRRRWLTGDRCSWDESMRVSLN